jgi:5-methylcytosine-specific restriction endonuclease McrA
MTLKEKILELRKEGYSYGEISKKLQCSKSTISFHCSPSYRKKAIESHKRYNETESGALSKKIGTFKNPNPSRRLKKSRKRRRYKKSKSSPLTRKLHNFKRRDKGDKKGYSKVGRIKKNYGINEVKEKIGEEPRCYLTGRAINLEKKSDFHFDHIQPVSKGGTNDLNNLGITCKEANQAKANLTTGEFVVLCAEILVHHGYKVKPPK